MKLKIRGKNTLKAEVVNISADGLWLLAEGQEYFLPYDDFPWFKKATVSQICNVRVPATHHLNWPDLDVDLEIESLANLEKYPLIYR